MVRLLVNFLEALLNKFYRQRFYPVALAIITTIQKSLETPSRQEL